eukprot:GHVU01116126.1.p1 GENE.GHVU01116126.1~~GHVU01116126.1.p1  ORF type:complete len:638 (+),score=81.46 GHVU01116126.1:2491-4404(+)
MSLADRRSQSKLSYPIAFGVVGCLLSVVLYLNTIDEHLTRSPLMTAPHAEVSAAVGLVEQSQNFPRQLTEVTDTITVAVGYGLANCAFIRGPKGIVLIDTMESMEAMEDVLQDYAEFLERKLNATGSPPVEPEVAPDSGDNAERRKRGLLLPISDIIITHFHPDHTLGTEAAYFPNFTELWVHEKTRSQFDKMFSAVGGATYIRGMFQFGTLLDDEEGFVNAGIGPRLRGSDGLSMGFVYPKNVWYGKKTEIYAGGLRLELHQAPGETSDQVIIYYPDENTLFAADNIYKAFPNLYAIRGSEPRDALEWAQSLYLMKSFGADHMVMGHTLPLSGKEAIADALGAYRSALLFVHDQTLYHTNKGCSLPEVVKRVVLPPHLKSHDYLQPHYGRVEWATKAVFNRYLGWYSGEVEELSPLSRADKAELMLQLAGGYEGMLRVAQLALDEDRPKASLELAIHALELNKNWKNMREIAAESLRLLAEREPSAPGRNWYLTERKVLLSRRKVGVPSQYKHQVMDRIRSAADLLGFLPVRLKASESLQVRDAVMFNITSLASRDASGRGGHEAVCVHVDRGVAYLKQNGDCDWTPSAVVRANDQIIRQVMKNKAKAAVAMLTGDLAVDGGILNLQRFMNRFDFD